MRRDDVADCGVATVSLVSSPTSQIPAYKKQGNKAAKRSSLHSLIGLFGYLRRLNTVRMVRARVLVCGTTLPLSSDYSTTLLI